MEYAKLRDNRYLIIGSNNLIVSEEELKKLLEEEKKDTHEDMEEVELNNADDEVENKRKAKRSKGNNTQRED